MSLGLLFSGQGTQHAQMLPWLDDDGDLVRRTCDALGIADWRSALTDSDWAGCNLAAWAQLAPRLPPPAAVAGYSVGELAAFGAAGVFRAEVALELATLRAEAMDRCASRDPGGMASVSGLQRRDVDALCAAFGTAVAIDLDLQTQVVGGPHAALEALETAAVKRGAKVGRLNIAIASHTPSMRPAVEAFAIALGQQLLTAPALPLYCNADGERALDAVHAAYALAQQIAVTVRWGDVTEALHSRRLSCVLEIGAGNALATAWNRRFPDVPARSADEFRTIAALVRWVDLQQFRATPG